MSRKTLLVSAASLILAGSAAFAYAQDAAPKAPAAPAAKSAQQGPQRDGGPKWGHGGPGGRGGEHGQWGHGHGREMGGVIGDLRGLERLYIMSGRAKELPALYNDVLAKSQNPMVRDYAYRHLARAQMAPTNVDAAIATMKKSLDESLANDQKRHQEMEAFKQRMQARSAGAQ
ncbi:hypothetical protein FIV34_16615 [Luteibacter pinisoli]|uniref:Uncharacterized protein n=1 Tax=Luteibacter pinisoli TaxID=2589080 RepID=A0A4Y5Z970_9GAMM|nr:hypothetical protein [Luteibacter pinisoli]QDE40713.1 hypothetical protein FIV34_16615 [Luteibacter pinisoli]